MVTVSIVNRGRLAVEQADVDARMKIHCPPISRMETKCVRLLFLDYPRSPAVHTAVRAALRCAPLDAKEKAAVEI